MKLPNLVIDKNTGKIISFGYTDFSNRLEEGQVQVQSPVEQLPDDINICAYKDGKVVVDDKFVAEQKNAEKKQRIMRQLAEIDKKKIRALTDAILFEDKSYLEKYEHESNKLRKALGKNEIQDNSERRIHNHIHR